MNDIERERRLFTNYPYHIAMLVKMAEQAIKEGRAEIKDGMLVMKEPPAAEDNKNTVRGSI